MKNRASKGIFYSLIIFWTLLCAFQLYVDYSGQMNNKHLSEMLNQAINSYCPVIIHIIILVYIIKVYRKFIIADPFAIMLLTIANVFLFLNDIAYYFASYISFDAYFLSEICSFTWMIAIIIFLSINSMKMIDNVKTFSYMLLLLFVINAIILWLFYQPIKAELSGSTSQIVCNLLLFLVEDIIFDLCVICLIFTNKNGILMILASLVILMVSAFMIGYSMLISDATYTTILNLPNKYFSLMRDVGEGFWLLGLILMFYGILIIKDKCEYNMKEWFSSNKGIKNQITLHTFFIATSTFILFFVLLYSFSIINKMILIGLPPFIMIYCLVVIVFSRFMGNKFEKPFIRMQAKIQSLFAGRSDYYVETFNNIIEFQNLNDFITDSYQYKTSLEKHIVSTATRIAHDIKSPVQIIENLIKNQSDSNQYNQEQLMKQINKISYISKSLLKENKKIIEDSSYGLQSLYCIIEDLIADKQIEWGTDNSLIDFEYKANQILWLSNEQSKIKNSISNLLNNAFEASSNTTDKIKISVNQENHNVVIHIQDSGCGFDISNLKDILEGKSFKVNGNGIGISSAQRFMASISGTFEINSKINYGTTIKLEFPKLYFPEQFANEIQISTNHIVVVDDNPNIITFWQEYFLFNTKQKETMYFINFRSLKNYLSDEKDPNQSTFLLDYNIFGEKLSVIDIIKEFNLKTVYLITDYAEDVKLQDEARLLDIKLIPKTMLKIMLQNKMISSTG